MARTKVDAMWEDLKGKGYFQSDKAAFDKYFYAPGEQGYKNRKALYDDLHSKGYLQSPTYEDFARKIGLHATNGGRATATQGTGQAQYEGPAWGVEAVGKQFQRSRSLEPVNPPRPLNRTKASQRLQRQKAAIDRQQEQQERQAERLKRYAEKRTSQLPGGMERFDERAGEYLATGEATPVPIVPNPEVVRGDMVMGDDGRLQQSYQVGDDLYSSRAGAEAELYRQAHPLEDELQQAYLERERLQEELGRAGNEAYDTYVGSGAAFMPLGAQGAAMHNSPEFGMLSAAYHQNELRIKTLERERDADGFWRTLGKELFSLDTWDMGAQEFMDAGNLLRFGNGDNLTPEQEDARESMLLNTFKRQGADQQYGENDTFAQRAATITANAIPFVVQFLATGGMEGVTAAGGKLGGKMAAKWATGRVGEWILKNTGVLAGDVAAGFAMANTVGALSTGADIMSRHQGQVVQGPDGTFRFEGGKSWGRSVWEGEAANTLEYYTEMLGAHIDGLGGTVGAWLASSKAGRKLGIAELSRMFSRVKGSEFYNLTSHMLKRGGFNDYPSEVFEEEANIVLNSLLVGDNKFSDLADSKTQLDIVGGMLLSVGFMQSPGVAGGSYQAAQYYRYKHATDVADQTARARLGDEKWDALKSGLDEAKNEEIMDILGVVLADESLPTFGKTAVVNYVSNLLKMRGYNLRTMADAKDKMDNPEQADDQQADTNAAYHEGYNAPDEQQNAIGERMNESAQRLMSMGYSGEDLGRLDRGEYDVAFLNSLPDDQRIAVLDYLNAKAALDGTVQHSQDEIENAVAQSDAQVDARTNTSSGEVITATLKDGRQVAITRGNVATVDNVQEGTIEVDNDASDGDLVVRDEQTGEIMMIHVTDIQQVDGVVDPEQLKAEAADNIRQTMAQEIAARINGDVQEGGSYDMIDEQGNTMHGTVLQLRPDNTAVVQVDGEQIPLAVSTQQLQAWVDNAKARMSMAPVQQQTTQQPTQGDDLQDNAAAQTDPVQTASVQAPVQSTNTENQPVTLPMDEKTGEPIWSQTTPEQGYNHLAQSGLAAEDIASLIDDRLEQADAAIAKASKGGTIDERLAARQAKNYWEKVKAMHDAAVASQAEGGVNNATNETAADAKEEAQPAGQAAPATTEGPLQNNGTENQAADNAEKTTKPSAEEQAEKRGKALRERAERWGDFLGVDVEVFDNVDDIEDEAVRKAIQQGKPVRAWFLPTTGKVGVYLPNIRDGYDMDIQIMHEVVGHHGMRKLFGDAALLKKSQEDRKRYRDNPDMYRRLCEEEYGKFCDRVFNELMTEKEREHFLNYAGVDGDQRAAADEFIAWMINRAGGLNERERTRLQQILDWLRGVINNLLREVNTTADERHELTRADVMDLLRASMKNLEETRNKEIGRQISTTLDGALEGRDRSVRRRRKPIRYSVQSIATGGGFQSVEDDGEGNVGFIIDGVTYNGNNPITVDVLKNAERSPLNLIISQALELGTLKDEQVDKIYSDYAALLNRMLEKGLKSNGGFYNLAGQWRWVAETVFRSVHENADDQYGQSIDITTICKKNEAVINAISEMQREQGYGVTPNQILHLYENTYKAGYQTPCPVCYVFSHYLTNGRHASTIINGWRKFGNMMGDPSKMSAKERDKRLKFFTDQYNKAVEWNERNKNLIQKAQEDIQHIEDEKENEFDQLAKQILSGKLSKKEEAAARKRIDALDKRYRAAVNLVAQANLDKWIKHFALDIKSKKDYTKNQLREDSWREVPDEMALDFRMTAESLRWNPGVQRLRSGDGSAGGKYIHQASNNELGEVLSMLGLSKSPRDAVNQWLEASRATTKKDRDSKDKAAMGRFERALKYMRRQSLRGGQRMWSWSDNIEALAPDLYINLLQMQLLGGTLQSYSKQLEGINLVARLGGYVNGSLMGLGKGFREVSANEVEEVGKGVYRLKNDITEEIHDNRFNRPRTRVLQQAGAAVIEQDGKYYTLVYDDVVGIHPFDVPEMDDAGKPTGRMLSGLFTLNKQLDKAGNILVGMNDMHNRIAMADPNVYFIIPYHKSSLSVHMLTSMYGLLDVEMADRDAMNYEGLQEDTFIDEGEEVLEPLRKLWEDHKNEKDFACGIEGGIPSGQNGTLSPQQVEYRALRNAIFMDKDLEVDDERMDKILADDFLKQVYHAVRGSGENKPGLMQTDDTRAIYPYEYWDENSTFDKADINGKRYLEYCRRLGVRPKFCGMTANGKMPEEEEQRHGNFVDYPGYWKTLIDRRMYDVNGKYQGLTPVDTKGFNVDLVDPEVTKHQFPVTRVADEQGTREIVKATIEQEQGIMGDAVEVDYSQTPDKALKTYQKALDDSKKKGAMFSVTDEELEQRDDEDIDIMNIEDAGAEYGDAPVRFSIVRDPLEIADIENDMLMNGYEVYYRAMSKLDDGLHQPMASMDDGQLREPVPEGAIERSEEQDIDSYITDEIEAQMKDLEKNGKKGQYVEIVPGKVRYYWGKKGCKMKFHLVRPRANGKGVDDLWAAYNPYLHVSDTPLNDQFSSAWRRPELVVVRVLVPKSEESVGEPARAKWAKNHPGKAKWKSGVVNSQLPPKQRRNVMLSRYAKIDGIVPVEEAVGMYADKLLKNNVAVPFNTVTPAERDELYRRGVRIVEPEANMGEECERAYEAWRGEHPDGPQGGVRFSLSETHTDKLGREVYTERRDDGALDREVVTNQDGSKTVTWFDEEGRKKERLFYFPDGEVSKVVNWDDKGHQTRRIQYDRNRHPIEHWQRDARTDWKRDKNGVIHGRSNGEEIRPYKYRFSLSEEDYSQAVESGDQKKIAKMVRDAVKAAMPNTKAVDRWGKPRLLYHGTPQENQFYEFNGTIYLSSNRSVAGEYTHYRRTFGANPRQTGRIMPVFVNLENPLEIDANRHLWRNIDVDWSDTPVTTRDIEEYAKQNGYDGVIIKRVRDNMYDNDTTAADVYIAFSPEQVKSAGPTYEQKKRSHFPWDDYMELDGEVGATYDDDGNLIPLSERFDMGKRDIRYSLDAAVTEAEQMTETNPTDGQKESGNYRKGHVKVDGFDISIEQPKGSVRSGVDTDGNEWSQEMHNTYGYIRGTEGVDGDHIDVFLSDHLDGWNGNVYVVDQVNKDRIFDEHKVMYGFNSEQEARDAYLSNYKEGWTGLGNITGVSREEFKKWVDSSHRKNKPFAEYKNVKPLQSTGTEDRGRFSVDVRDGLMGEANAMQKVPGREAQQRAVDLDDVRFSLSRSTRETIGRWFDKRDDLSDDQKEAVMQYLDEFDDKKLQLAAARWYVNGTVRLPEDMPKVEQAVQVANKVKVDPLQYSSPMELINQFPQTKIKAKPIDPETVPTLHNGRDVGHGIRIYDVEESEESRQNMRQIINTHFGEDASPWCLLQGDGGGNLTEESRDYWDNYNAYPKRVAFKDGKLIAFSANDYDEVTWWDRMDEPHRGIEIEEKVPNDKLGRKKTAIVDADDGTVSYDSDNMFRGNKQNGTYEEWDSKGVLIVREQYKNGKEHGMSEVYDSNGDITSRTSRKEGKLDGLSEEFYQNGKVRSRRTFKDGELDGLCESFWPDGKRKIRQYKKGRWNVGDYEQWHDNGQLKSIHHYDAHSNEIGVWLEYNQDGQVIERTDYSGGKKNRVFEQYNSLNGKVYRSYYRNGQIEERETWSNGNLERHDEWSDRENTYVTTDKKPGLPPEGFPGSSSVRFSLTDEQREYSPRFSLAPTFYSNAAKAVEGVKQEKAKAEQWKAMLTKAGGIKAGEDKWMGLSTWLDEHKGETLTKDEVCQFVADNGIEMEEVNYGDKTSEIKKGLDDFANEFDSIVAQKKEEGSENDVYDEAFADMVEKYGEDFDMAFMVSKTNFPESSAILVPVREYGGELSDAAKYFLGVDNQEDNLINKTRLDYTTPGLENKREIAFVVPGVEPYQEHDEIHFGPENQGRAVMWVRFGETTDTDGNRVLVIDEIQSNRHQDAREKGYKEEVSQEIFTQRKKTNEVLDDLNKKYPDLYAAGYNDVASAYRNGVIDEADYNRVFDQYGELEAALDKQKIGGIPAAPFEKNWHEVAMKRMLRLAAEEGFDKVAWTTGEQQAERYDIGHAVRSIGSDPEEDGSHSVFVTTRDGDTYEMVVGTDGKIESNNAFDGKNAVEVFGKEIAEKIMNAEDSIEFTGDDLRVGGYGMKAFYDQMLPQFMNKYGKRWGVKVGEVTLNTPGKETMHSVDVNEDMKRSVMQGQPLFSMGDGSPRDVAIASGTYERMLRRSGFQFQEAVQDSMLSLKRLYQAVLGRKTHIEDVPDNENAYLAENAMSSINAAEQHEYFTKLIKPLLAAIYNLAGKDTKKRQELVDYMMAKHGLERNLVLADRDAQEAAAAGGDYNVAYAENREKDYSGLTALTGESDVAAAETIAQQMVDDYERDHDTTELWSRVKAATGATLYKMYSSGLMSKSTYDKTVQMFEYYIPLRGWDETTSDEVYGYLTDKSGPLGSPIKHARGRSSKADDPIATIALMADDTIRAGNRNLMKQKFLIFAQNHPSDLVSVNSLWLQYNDVTDEWEPVFADIEADDTPEEVAQKVEAFEARMEQLASNEPKKYKRGRDAVNIPFKVVKNNLAEHQILVKRGGETYVLTINGNPRAAQALNGMTNPDVKIDKGIISFLYNTAQSVNRELSAFYTTRNPDFIMSNFLRDTLYSNCMTWVKEGRNYALKFHKNFGKFNPAVLFRLFQKWENGTLDMSNPTEQMFYQFMSNGGETGYTNVKDIEGHKRTIVKELRRQNSPIRKGWHLLGEEFDVLNRSVENCARFAAFVTSREMGRSIGRSVYDAKEVSVNFNKKGAGDKLGSAVGENIWGKIGSGISGAGRTFWIFWNAGVQGMTNFGRAFKRHPAKAIAGAASMFALGAATALLAQAMGGDDEDDKDYYYNLPENVRRSNICFRLGSKLPWITIPLPIEFRAIYGLGEMAVGVLTGKERYSKDELAYNIISQVSQILPLDLTEGEGGLENLMPTVGKTWSELAKNKTWYGMPIYKDTPFNKDMPQWTKAYSSANQYLVSFTRWLNEVTGGNDYKKGKMDWNPAKIEYALKSYLGGITTTIDHLVKSFDAATGRGEFNWRDVPLASRVLRHGDERTAFRKAKNEYFNFKSEAEETKRLLNAYQKDTADPVKYAKLLNMMHYSPEYGRYLVFEAYNERVEDLRKAIKEGTAPADAEQLENEAIRDLVDAMHNYDSSTLGKDIAKGDKKALEKAYDSDSVMREIVGKELAKQAGLENDKYNKEPAWNASERTKRTHETYERIRNNFDRAEDVILESEQKKAVDAKDKERYNTIKSIQAELNKIRTGKDATSKRGEVIGLGQGDDERIMNELREARKQVIADMKNDGAEKALENLKARTKRLGLRARD